MEHNQYAPQLLIPSSFARRASPTCARSSLSRARAKTVERNLFREIGIWEKQSSAIFQGKAAGSVMRHNVIFNLARAGINVNDGHGGGDSIYENVLFNTCRESSDHGPINSWDRQPFLTTVRTGKPSMQMAWRDVTRNLVIANYGGSKEVEAACANASACASSSACANASACASSSTCANASACASSSACANASTCALC